MSTEIEGSQGLFTFFSVLFMIDVTFCLQKPSIRVRRYWEVNPVTDIQIIELYWARNEEAIRETDYVYGRRLHNLADKIVQNFEDAQECVNDTYMKTWDTIPPQRPEYFFAYLAKLCRNFSLGVLDWKSAAKRKGEVVTLTQEMEACIPDPSHDRKLEGQELGEVLNRFLESLSQDNRVIFLRRYWYLDSITEIAYRYGMTESKVKTQLHRTRAKLHSFLAKEGITV